jgi:ADP-ribose pyrophosphatase YjhB (NUDIX family)
LLSCPECGFIFWNNPKPTTSALIYKDSKVLMFQRTNEPLKDYWCMPGGFANYEEDPRDTIVREVKEETGMAFKIEGLVGVYRIDSDPRGIHIDLIYYGQAEGEFALPEEHVNMKFFNMKELPEKVAYKHRQAIEDWVKKTESGRG